MADETVDQILARHYGKPVSIPAGEEEVYANLAASLQSQQQRAKPGETVDRGYVLPYARSVQPKYEGPWSEATTADVFKHLDTNPDGKTADRWAVPGILRDIWESSKAVGNSASLNNAPYLRPSQMKEDELEHYLATAGAGTSAVMMGGLGRAGLGPRTHGMELGSAGGKPSLPSLPMDEASRLARAREMGFDPDKKWYHGTSRTFDEFDPNAPHANDAGHYGAGTYFAQSPGEASYYGPNVGEYVVRAKNPLALLDDSPVGGRDMTALGHFKDWAPKLDKIGYLDDQGREILAAVRNAEEIAKGARVLPSDAPGGGEAFTASVNLPNGMTARTWPATGPRTRDETLRELTHQIMDETYRGKTIPSLASYIMRWHPEGSTGLSDKAKAAGHDAIRYGDEFVVFDPRNIRSSKAAFDPAKADSANLLAAHPMAAALTPYLMDRKSDNQKD